MKYLKGAAAALLLLASTSVPIANAAPSCTTTNPCLSVRNVSIVEGDSGAKYANFYIDVTSPRTSTVTFEFTTTDGTAKGGVPARPHLDYAPVAGLDSIGPSDGSQLIQVPVYGDVQTEADETFFLDIVRVTGGQVADGRGQATIRTDDTPEIRVGNASVTESDSGQKIMLVPVTLSKAHSDKIVYVTLNTANGSAVANSDYWPKNNVQLAWMPETLTLTQYVGVTIFPDNQVEGTEIFYLNASNALDGVIVDSQGVGTILDDDKLPSPPQCPPNLPNCQEP